MQHRDIPFSVWAPKPGRVDLVLGGATLPMQRHDDGWWTPVEPPMVQGEVDYGYRLDGSDPRPDPRSVRQPDGVHGLSRTFDPEAHAWSDGAWTGRQLAGSVIYELHIGTFTSDGTFAAAIERLDHLVELGVDLVEVLPVNAFNGERGWGYDGVLWFAVHEAYGGPAGYQAFVDACHQRGLGVIQDVVYNHLGPSGNYLPEFGPYYNEHANTSWGTAINLDGSGSDEVRRFVVDNALWWLDQMHVDGLRLDAVHALTDPGRAVDILEDLSIATDRLSAHLRRPLTLIAESDLNNPRLITPRAAGGFGLDAQWSDDFHHALMTNLTGEVTGWFADFDQLDALVKVLTHGYFHDGTTSTFRGRIHGRPLDLHHTPGWRLVVCSANHDQIGNRADGSRPRTRLNQGQLKIAAALTLLGPFTPMLFMGEEWGASTPWAFFSSHPEPELAAAVSRGRREEFLSMDWDPDSIPDPQAASTFTRSRLDWSEAEGGDFASLLDWHRELIALRRREADLTDPDLASVTVQRDPDAGWLAVRRGGTVLLANFDAEAAEVSWTGEVLAASAVPEPGRIAGHAVLVLRGEVD